MGQQFVEVTSLRYGGRSVISKRSLNGCPPGYKLSMASEGSRTALKHAATKQTCRLRSTGCPFELSLPPSPRQIIILFYLLLPDANVRCFTRFVHVSYLLVRSLSSLLSSYKTKGTLRQPGRLLRQRSSSSTRFFRQSVPRPVSAAPDPNSCKSKVGSSPLLAGSYYAWGEFQRP